MKRLMNIIIVFQCFLLVSVSAQTAAEDSLLKIKDYFIINNLSGDFNSSEDYPVIAIDTTDVYAIAWLDRRTGYEQIYMQFYNLHDRKIGKNIRINDKPTDWNNEPLLACNKKGDYLVAWLDDSKTVMGQRLNNNGEKIGNNFKLNQNWFYSISDAKIAVSSSGKFVVVSLVDGTGGYDLYADFFNPNGARINGSVLVNNGSGKSITSSLGFNISSDDSNNYFVTWSAKYNNRDNVFLQRLSADGYRIGENLIVNDTLTSVNYNSPYIASLSSGRSMIIYNGVGVHGKIIDFNSNFISGEMDIFGSGENLWRLLSVSSNLKDKFYVAKFDTSASVRIVSAEGDSISEIKPLQKIDNFRYYGYSPSFSNFIDGRAYALFNSIDRGVQKLYMLRYKEQIQPVGNFINVSDAQFSSWQTQPRVATNSEGISLVIWDDTRNGYNDIYARLFDENFNLLGEDFMLNNTSLKSFENFPKSVIPLSDGNFVTAFATKGINNYEGGIYLQKIDQAGNKLGKAVFVGTVYLSRYKIYLNSNSENEIVVVWYDTNTGYVSWRKYNSELIPFSGSKNILRSYNGFALKPISVSINENLETFAAWMLNDANGSNKIIGLTFDENGNAISDTAVIYDFHSNVFIESLIAYMDKDKNVTLIWSDFFSNVTLYRKLSQKNITLERKFNGYGSMTSKVIFMKNNKLFLTYSLKDEVYYYFANDNIRTERYGRFFTFPTYDRYSLRYYTANDASIFNNKLFLVYESNVNGETGYDIWGGVFEADFADTSKEYFYEKITDDFIYPVYPNPANSSLNISYQIFSYHDVKIAVYDILGREVAVLVNKPQESGLYRFKYDTSKLSSGVYFLRMNAFHAKVVKFIVMK